MDYNHNLTEARKRAFAKSKPIKKKTWTARLARAIVWGGILAFGYLLIYLYNHISAMAIP